MKPFRIGVIGLGDHGVNIIIPAILNIPNVQIQSVCDLDEDRAILGKRLARAKSYFLDYKQMLSEENLDAVIMAGPPEMHFLASLYAIKNNVSVFTEKPPCVSKKQIIDLSTECNDRGVFSGVGFNFRYSNSLNQMRKYIEQCKLNIDYIFIRHFSSKPKDPFWDLKSNVKSFLLSQAIHQLDTLLYFSGPVEKIHVLSKRSNKNIITNIQLEFKNGSIGELLTGNNIPNFQTSIEIFTMENVLLRLDNLWKLTIYDQSRIPTDLNDRKRWGNIWAPSPLDSGYKRTGYELEMAEFISCVKEHKEFSPSFKDSIPTYELIEKIEKEVERND
jgi:phthalate 4,5-cis-dihydrodiol dehydrogenase